MNTWHIHLSTITRKIVLLFFLLTCSNTQSQIDINYPNLIAHACGILEENLSYTNCKEAFIASLEKGYKFIEVDLSLTTDSQLVLVHDWEIFNQISGHQELGDSILSLDIFSERKIYEKYTPMNLRDIIDFMDEYPDIIIVTDKISDIRLLDPYFSSYKDRVLIEAFSIEDYNKLKNNGYHPMLSCQSNNILLFNIENLIEGNPSIDFIVDHISDDFQEIRRLRCLIKLKTAMYTSNDIDFIYEHLGNETDLIYTDNVEP